MLFSSIKTIEDDSVVIGMTCCQSIEELENEMLNGQKLQGPATSAEVHRILKQKNLVDKYVNTLTSVLVGPLK